MTSREAFADAAAGVCGSLVAMLAFYPIDVIKTNLQADKPSERTSTIQNKDNKVPYYHNKKNSIQVLISAMQNLKSLTRGLHYKAAHTVTSSFIYFFLYSWIQSHHRLYHAHKHRKSKYLTQDEKQRGEFVYRPSTSDRLILSAIAAMMNTVLTLPLDVLAARSQTTIKDDTKTEESTVSDCEFKSTSRHPSASKSTKRLMDLVWDDMDNSEINDDQCRDTKEGEGRIDYSKSCLLENNFTAYEKKGHTGQIGSKNHNEFHNKPMKNEDNKLSPTSNPIFRIDSLSQLRLSSLFPKRQKTLPLNNISGGLWQGLWPSLLLCSNPSIHFTVFDIVKESVLKYKSGNEGALNLREAFVIGIIAKFAATIVTYPLIRAKVLLMISTKTAKGSSSRGNLSEKQSETSMVGLLKNTYASDGIMGLYKGCQLQLLHTLLKSALLMMVREKITVSSRRLILGKQ